MRDSIAIALVFILIYVADIVAIALVFARKRDSTSVVSWLLAILFLPGLGAFLFFVFGLDRVPRRLKRKLAHRVTLPEAVAGVSTATYGDDSEGGRDGWEGLCALAEAGGSAPVRGGNAITLLAEGTRAFDSIFEAIRGAKHHIHVQEYIYRDDRLGRELLNLMIEKCKQGVEVRLLVDAIGSRAAWRLLRKLKEAGGHGAVFMPLLPYGKVFLPNLRNHRKIIVCDGETGFLGGLNVGEEYASRRFRRRHWQDVHVRIQGPTVHDLQRVFIEDWDFAAGRILAGEAYFPPTQSFGASRAQIVSSGPDEESNSTHRMFFAAIARARRTLQIATPYLVPDLALRTALATAAQMGVQVSILTQGMPPDAWATYWCSRYFWTELLESGVKLYEYQAGMMHSKLIVADDCWSMVGSANVDNRSLRLNFEVNAVLDSDDDALKVRAIFERDLTKSRPVTLKTMAARPWSYRVLEEFFRLFAPLL